MWWHYRCLQLLNNQLPPGSKCQVQSTWCLGYFCREGWKGEIAVIVPCHSGSALTIPTCTLAQQRWWRGRCAPHAQLTIWFGEKLACEDKKIKEHQQMPSHSKGLHPAIWLPDLQSEKFEGPNFRLRLFELVWNFIRSFLTSWLEENPLEHRNLENKLHIFCLHDKPFCHSLGELLQS